MFAVARNPTAEASTRQGLAAGFGFTELPIALPPGSSDRTVREVNRGYEAIRSWVSSVGAAVAVNDLQGTGTANDLCLVDTRTDRAIVTPAPGTGDRYQPFVLDPAPLPTAAGVAPMGCVPGDFNLDGRMDLLVYYWGRTPVVFLHRPEAGPLSAASYVPTELVTPPDTSGEGYHGALWNTNAVNVADFDGDGHPDIGVFNYFADSAVLDSKAPENVHMNDSMSRALNGGGAHVLRWMPPPAGAPSSIRYQEVPGAVPPDSANGWTLGAASADLDGDLLPELYLANDFGPDHLFHNVSTPGHIAFKTLTGRRGAFTPKSFVLGHDSFKGMSADFGDLGGTGRFDLFVSNITTDWGLEESNFAWMNNAGDPAAAKAKMQRGTAPFDQKAADMKLAWTGWGWDAKMADFDNDGRVEIVQADGFVKGDINRWNWLQELAASNDMMLENPAMWPKAGPGDDIAGSQEMAFWTRGADGSFVNINKELGMAVPVPTRGVAVGDVNDDGGQDFAVARQWAAPAFYRNNKPGGDRYVDLRLYRPVPGSTGVRGTPAYGAQVKITTASGRSQIAQLDGGGGHSGKRSFELSFGLGDDGGRPVRAEICWRDLGGVTHKQTVELRPGRHDLMLTTEAVEVAAS